MRLHIIGSGCPVPYPNWYGSSFILEIGDEMIMVDCGPATTYKMSRMGLDPMKVDHVFLTHHHYDHNVDFPCFALSRWDSCVERSPLKLYGPQPTEKFADSLLGENGVFTNDWKSRVEHPVSQDVHSLRGGVLPRPDLIVEAKDLSSGSVVETSNSKIIAKGVHHLEPGLESLAFRFDTAEGSVLFAGDCADCPQLREMAKDVDTLVIACATLGVMPGYERVMTVITGSSEVSEIVKNTNIKKVILTHVAPVFHKPGMREKAIAEIVRAGFKGDVFFPDELTSIEI